MYMFRVVSRSISERMAIESGELRDSRIDSVFVMNQGSNGRRTQSTDPSSQEAPWQP